MQWFEKGIKEKSWTHIRVSMSWQKFRYNTEYTATTKGLAFEAGKYLFWLMLYGFWMIFYNSDHSAPISKSELKLGWLYSSKYSSLRFKAAAPANWRLLSLFLGITLKNIKCQLLLKEVKGFSLCIY